MKTEHWTGEMPCSINGFRNFEFLIQIDNEDRNTAVYHIACIKEAFIKAIDIAMDLKEHWSEI